MQAPSPWAPVPSLSPSFVTQGENVSSLGRAEPCSHTLNPPATSSSDLLSLCRSQGCTFKCAQGYHTFSKGKFPLTHFRCFTTVPLAYLVFIWSLGFILCDQHHSSQDSSPTTFSLPSYRLASWPCSLSTVTWCQTPPVVRYWNLTLMRWYLEEGLWESIRSEEWNVMNEINVLIKEPE